VSGLVLKLGPKERLLINGAVIENGERRSRVTVLTSNAKILRLKDAIHLDDATTPVKRACCLARIIHRTSVISFGHTGSAGLTAAF